KKLRHATGDTSREPRNCRAFQFANKSFRQCKRKHTPKYNKRTEGKSGGKGCKMHEREEVKAEIRREKRKIEYKNLTSIIVSSEHRADILNIWTDNGTSRGHSVNVWSTKVYSGVPKAFPADIRKPNSRNRFLFQVEMGTCWFVVWVLFVCFIGDARPQYRDKNITNPDPRLSGYTMIDYLSRFHAFSHESDFAVRARQGRRSIGRNYMRSCPQANWYRASQYCRYHGMHLASIASQEENDRLEKHIKDFGLGHEHFWTSGTDQAEEGTFFWMANGRPITFENWNVGEPNNFRYENGEEEHCLELWNRDGKGLKWNDSPCSFETFFVCEVQ
ncbi:Aggrecan core protein, partial [Cyphomyrmex costatus]